LSPRVGQNLFRDGLLGLWEEQCAVTGLAVPSLLRASHIKPWADCETDAERLDVYNGFLLAPNLDAAFDRGFITVADDGAIVVSDMLGADARVTLGLDKPLRVRGLADSHRAYLPWHRTRVQAEARRALSL
jgi:putative restriction endonuclease